MHLIDFYKDVDGAFYYYIQGSWRDEEYKDNRNDRNNFLLKIKDEKVILSCNNQLKINNERINEILSARQWVEIKKAYKQSNVEIKIRWHKTTKVPAWTQKEIVNQ